MRIGHYDSAGKQWVFDVPVNKPLQAGMFARFLRTVRNVGAKETAGTLHTTEYIAEIKHLSREVEQTVLRALSERYPVQDTDGGKGMFML
jgi:hypothetical protein